MPKASAARRSTPPPAPQPANHRTRSTVWVQTLVVFAVALFVRALHFAAMREALVYDVLICDAWGYDQWARRIAGGEWLGNEVFYQTPLYPYLLAIVYAAVGPSVWAVRIVQALLGAAACVMLARAGGRFFSERVGWLAGLTLALYPPAIFFDGILQKASLDLFLMTALVWATGALEPRARWFLVAACGLIAGLLTLNRENAAVLVPLVLAWVVWRSWNEPRSVRWRNALLYGLAVSVVLVPVGLRNKLVGGTFLLTTSQMGSNFYIGNHRGASGCYEPLRTGRGDPRHESQDARLLAEEARGRELTPSEISDYWMERSWQDMAADPGGWLRLLAWKALLTWNTVELVDGEGPRVHAHDSLLLGGLSWVLHFGVLCPFAVLGVWWTRHDWRRLWILYAMLLSLATAVTVFYVFARYRYPLVPVATLFAAAGGVGLWDRIRGVTTSSRRELAGLGIVALLVALACNWPLRWLYDDEVTYFNVGTALLDANRPADALQPLEHAAGLNPTAAAFNNLGRAALAAGDMQRADASFGRALAIDPTLAVAWYGVGEVAQKQGELTRAAERYRKAAELDPRLAIARRALGRLELSRGQLAAGIVQLRAAVEQEPRSAAARADLAAALAADGQLTEAIEQLQAAIRFDPNTPAENDLAWILATAADESLRNGAQALALAQHACRAPHDQAPERLDTWAAAQAEVGQFEQALETISRAIELAQRGNQAELVQTLKQRQQLYLERRPYRDPSLKVRR